MLKTRKYQCSAVSAFTSSGVNCFIGKAHKVNV